MKEKIMHIKFPSVLQWEALLARWSDFPNCGEKRLLCAVIALAITDAYKDHELAAVPLAHGFWGRSLENICVVIHLDPVFVREQILVAISKVGDPMPLEFA